MTEDVIKKFKRLRTADKRREKIYGITPQEWAIILLYQNGKCAICKEALTKDGKLKRICVDHIHAPKFKKMSQEDKRKYVRGGLCFLCNTAIKFEKSGKGRQMLEGMVDYFNKYSFKGEIE